MRKYIKKQIGWNKIGGLLYKMVTCRTCELIVKCQDMCLVRSRGMQLNRGSKPSTHLCVWGSGYKFEQKTRRQRNNGHVTDKCQRRVMNLIWRRYVTHTSVVTRVHNHLRVFSPGFPGYNFGFSCSKLFIFPDWNGKFLSRFGFKNSQNFKKIKIIIF